MLPRHRALAIISSLLLAVVLLAPAGASASTGAAISAPDGLQAERPTVRPSTSARARAAQAETGDPRAIEQWPLLGDGPMGSASAWRQTTGGDVTVAIVDSGVDLTHPDLAPNLWTNPGEIPGNGVDDDGNGYVDDVHGADVIDGDGDPQDANGHGTHVAGIVAARGGNGIGVSGVAWQARIMAVRVLNAEARGTTAGVAAGIRYAVANGARIINLSLAGPTAASDLEDAIIDAEARGILVVVAAGNEGHDLGGTPTYPASFAEANVIGVAATRADGALSSISDFGPGADLAAPGEDILSTAAGGGYEWRTGTSMAAPHVTGTLVLLAAARPDLDWHSLRDALLQSTRATGLPVERGSLDAGAALLNVIGAAQWRPATQGAHAGTATQRSAATKAAAGSLKAKKKAKKAKRKSKAKVSRAAALKARRAAAARLRAQA